MKKKTGGVSYKYLAEIIKWAVIVIAPYYEINVNAMLIYFPKWAWVRGTVLQE